MVRIRVLTLFLLLLFNILSGGDLLNPSQFLGYEPGDRFTRHHRIVEYFEHVAAVSPHIKLNYYGESYEHRPLLVAIIVHPDQKDNLEQIRTDNLRRAGLLKGKPSTDKTAIVWLSYNVHGNEANSSEASLKTIYDFADLNNKNTQDWLKNTVVIIDPCINPDGRDRYTNWFNQVGNLITDANPQSREHMEPWPGGRTNHYYFDLNRDWAWQTQIESSQRMKLYNSWLPHVHVDFHEQGYNNPYYFAPAVEPFHEVITDWQREFQTTIGQNNAKYFDQNNWLYFTGEIFDLLYPSYGDTYPTYNGAIGMTYEQAGGSRGGLAVETDDGDTLTLKERLTHHYTTSLSTVEITSKHAEKVVEEFEKFFETAQKNPPGLYKAYVVRETNNPDKLKDLMAWLDAQDIRYGNPTFQRRTLGFNYLSGETGSFKLNKRDLVISAYQPKSVLVQVLFEPKTALSDTMTYDITAWAVPYLYGLDAYAVKSKIPIKPVGKSGGRIKKIEGHPYAYLLPWKGIQDLRFLSDLLKENFLVRFAERSFQLKDTTYDPGTLIITRKGNDKMGERFDKLVQKIARKHNRQIQPAYTGMVNKGRDFGSAYVNVLKAPKIAILSGDGVYGNAFGEVWHFFERQIGYPVTILGTDYFNHVALHKYDVLILPAGGYGFLTDENIEDIQRWVKAGGRLVLMGNSLNKFADKEGFGLTAYATEDAKKAAKKKAQDRKLAERLRSYGDRERDALSSTIRGSIVKVDLDNSHPLAFGYGETYFSLNLDGKRYTYLPKGWNVGVVKDSTALVSGFAGYKAQENFRESLALGVEDLGRGQVIYLADNLLFRGYWHNGKLLFGNAVFLVGQK